MSAGDVRGAVALDVGGETVSLCLTLGALAEIERALGCEQLSDLDARLRALSARDLVVILTALLKGGGSPVALAHQIAPDVAARAIADAFRAALA